MILVDTDVWIDFLRNDDPGAAAVKRLLVERGAAMAASTVFELFAGIRGPRRLRALEALLGQVSAVPLSAAAARIAAERYTALKAAGRLIGNGDLLLAGTAIDLGAAILTRNTRHFERVEGLVVLNPADLGS